MIKCIFSYFCFCIFLHALLINVFWKDKLKVVWINLLSLFLGFLVAADFRTAANERQRPDLGSEIVVERAVDKGVVAGRAHRQPVEAEIHGVVSLDHFTRQQNHVAVQREPADCKNSHHHDQHLHCHPLPPAVGVALGQCHVTNGITHPQLLCHDNVHNSDYWQRYHIEQDKGAEVQILPEEIRWLREAGQTYHPYVALTEVRTSQRKNNNNNEYKWHLSYI